MPNIPHPPPPLPAQAPQALQSTSGSHSNIKMFSQALTALALTAIPLLATANPIHTGNSTCNSGPVQCCDSTALASSPEGANALSALHIVVKDINVVLGLQCSPISIIGVGISASCGNQAVCCEDNSHHGVAINCIPVQI
ncbi:fungal hydrophobin-domain-containing protein [Fomes fomentarius]|nr:fungal hydrophobin-domain-containing protein [Fomes fomentarius]